MTGLAYRVTGLVAGIASLLLLLVEMPAGRHNSMAQHILVPLAFVGLFGFMPAGLLAGGVLRRRPAAEVSRSGVRVFGWREVPIPWPMIIEVTAIRDGKGLLPALRLANKQVLPLKFAAQVASDDAEILKLLDAAMVRHHQLYATMDKSHRKQHAKAREQWAATALADVPGPFVRRDLPGPVVFGIPRPRFPGWSRAVAVGAPVFLVGLKLVAALTKGYSSDTGTQGYSSDTGRLVLAIGEGWIGWRSRTARHWRVLPFSDIVSITTATYHDSYHSLVIKRADGRGLKILESTLRAGAAAALLPSLVGHPGLDPAASDVLTWAATAGTVKEDRWSRGPVIEDGWSRS